MSWYASGKCQPATHPTPEYSLCLPSFIRKRLLLADRLANFMFMRKKTLFYFLLKHPNGITTIIRPVSNTKCVKITYYYKLLS